MTDKKKKILVIAGARPNFMKIAPLLREFRKYKTRFRVNLVHTGQHYDSRMSDVFFRDLGMSMPDIYLGVGSGSQAVQTANLMTAFEKVLIKERPEWIVVVGDVNSTLACSLVASKLNVKVAHVEAGLRSFDRTMPEEINRVVTDSLSDALFVSEQSGLVNLKKEGVAKSKVFFTGNVMIDTLLYQMPKIEKSDILSNLKITPGEYGVLTLHRPGNVDEKKSLMEIHKIIRAITSRITLVYAMHPRTKKMIGEHGLNRFFSEIKNLITIEPLGYIDFIKLVKHSAFVLTDSGGIQEETTVLKIPCLTMRENTERPVTIKEGTNILVGRDPSKIIRAFGGILKGKNKRGKTPGFWDGQAARRIVKIMAGF
ncbi:MAG: UDP-N-acetylglucosamine 2-epimerase (non-hydrolyzing) [Candidatus Aureabacteria bacterium]|nr:UDP-N-acetylglucosamine 2-epimerase (non-hydrolyzing) [Candidatus Auribacterota bacterium]